MMRLISTLGIVGLSLLSPFSHAEKVLTPLNHQQVIAVKPKESILVKLPADPSTGYMWFFDTSNPPTDAVKMVQDWKFTPRKTAPGQVQGDTTWRFHAQQEGSVTLRFIYRKPWQSLEEVPPLDVREYQLIISSSTTPGNQS